MTKNIFMSYSRRELGFVDDLVSKLEREKYNVWLDYRALVPGSPWNNQIEKGLKDSDTVLLVVSKAALASKYVTTEWRYFLKANQRVILLIFEAVDLPKELERFEWVDFRGSYEAGLKELFSQLKQPLLEKQAAPQTGFKAPLIVWAAIAVSVVVAVISFFEYWTLFLPWILAPLPYQIYKRKFIFTQVQTSLLALPIASLFSLLVYEDQSLESIVWLGLVFGLILLFILRSPAMQRWGKPEAIIPKYTDPRDANIQYPTPTPFYVDHVVQDRVIAEDMINALKKYGHPQVDNIQDAQAVVVLISQFKSDTEAVPEKQMVLPVMIQTNNKIAEKLYKIQWIDFRAGVRGLETIAQLLPNPKELLKALGMRPDSTQTVYSPVITALYYFIIFLSLVNIGSAIDYIFDSDVMWNSSEESYILVAIGFVVSTILSCGISYFMIRGLTSRKGVFSSFGSIRTGIFILGVLLLGEFLLDQIVLIEIKNNGVDTDLLYYSFVNVAFLVYFLGIFAIGFVFFRNRRDVKQWFPSKQA